MSEITGVSNRVTVYRQKRGLSAADLAARVQIGRQTIYAIESGSYLPNTAVALRLARVLEVSVEDLFSLPAEQPLAIEQVTLLPQDQAPRAGDLVELCKVDRRLVASAPSPVPWYLPSADAVLVETPAGKPGKAMAQLFQENTAQAARVLVAGCDPGVSVLARHMLRAGVELVAAQRNSTQSLALLKDGLVHVAGTHLRDAASGESNLPAIHKTFARKSVAVISLAVWEEGLVVAAGNPKTIRSVADCARRDVSIVNREPGAGSRVLLDQHLKQLGIATAAVDGYQRLAGGHLMAAWQVRAGAADCAIATRAAARAFNLDFIPLSSERYDLVVRTHDLDYAPVAALLDTLNRASFRRELEGLGGYDTSSAGRRVL